MPPEVSGILRTQIDSRADIYSLGILFYRLLSGSLPYGGQDMQTLIHQHVAHRAEPPSSRNPVIPPILDHIVQRLVAKEPQNRYQTLSALLFDLEKFQKKRQQGQSVIDFTIARKDRIKTLSYEIPLFGREKELALLKSLLASINESGSLCLVYGDAGIGKSRLVEELSKEIPAVNGIFVSTKCNKYESPTPYGVIGEVIRNYLAKLKRRSANEQQTVRENIEASLGS